MLETVLGHLKSSAEIDYEFSVRVWFINSYHVRLCRFLAAYLAGEDDEDPKSESMWSNRFLITIVKLKKVTLTKIKTSPNRPRFPSAGKYESFMARVFSALLLIGWEIMHVSSDWFRRVARVF